MSDSNKPGGAIWKTGIHKVSLAGQPVRLAAPQYSLLQNYNLMKRKIREEGHIPIGIDHIPEQTLNANQVLKKLLEKQELDPYDVGRIVDVVTDGESIRIKDAEFTNPIVQELFNQGELESWSVVQDVKAAECPTDKADVVADYFSDIERVDLVGKGGCETCLVEGGGVPEGYERINAKFMEVDTLTEEDIKGKHEGEVQSQKEGEDGLINQGEDGHEGEGGNEGLEEDPVQVLQNQVASLTETVGTLTDTVTGLVEGKIEAKLPDEYKEKLKEVDKLKLEASKAKVGSMIDAKIKAGVVTPAMKDGLLEAGLSMPEDGFKKLLASYKVKLWEPEQKSAHTPEQDDTYTYETYKKRREAGYKTA